MFQEKMRRWIDKGTWLRQVTFDGSNTIRKIEMRIESFTSTNKIVSYIFIRTYLHFYRLYIFQVSEFKVSQHCIRTSKLLKDDLKG